MNLNQQLLAIHLTQGIGIATESRLIEAMNSNLLPSIYPWPLDLLLQITHRVYHDRIRATYTTALQRASNFKGNYITYSDDSYPQRLREIFEPPLVLFYEGQLAALNLPSLSVVGTRSATVYGLNSLRHLLPPVIQSSIAIVSGLAQGIDVMAHQITFANNGVPIAVIGTGTDVAYPRRNTSLQKQIIQQGLVVSEYGPGVGPHRSHFPARNRIIAGLSSATLVVEAKIKSGSLITANAALQNNREVLSIPGSIFSEESQGTNELLSLGAKLITKSQDIIESVQILDTI
ncbi:DNA-processing protein DprA [Leuconostoc gelidum]|uniref:DNA-processing protein DprA n=1 Tax=Leuconostoc gelidum subsp. gelidum TaxID=1607839 RepID=A0AB35G137_LEUGE|nr:DNA-processing protein DprA [Leuconostoc gelidum]AFS40511.1 DNA processing protein [Leuconostoc gelidum JB7]MBZ5963645.1 DNA-processing protein DprA [Leuconostoc gelidum subsp. gelidum]MBZ5975512.1 DNA-processing protein DprA [Leuconostoc gelidum subsp. gelidum]MBZ5976318.1 DNA-processing protein DprA [Leuconostoc gelidum subsp. gelidum]MBZ5978412.1 DNA-processing protein DprA [Leuconostoc gelidum subsp. gelidum]